MDTTSHLPRTLVISPNWIGDAVMAQPLLCLLREMHPTRPIDVLAPSWVAPVWKAMSEVDVVLEAPFRHGALQLRERLSCAKTLKQRNYADAYVLPNTLKFALIPWLAGIPKRVGYRGEMRYGVLNVIHHDDSNAPRPMVSFYAALATDPCKKAVALPALPRPSLRGFKTLSPEVTARLGLQPDKPLLAFAPGAEFGSAKRWPASYFSELAQEIIQAYPDMQVVLLGSGKDKSVCNEIADAAPFVHNLAGKSSLDEAIGLIAKAEAMISNDSGLLHIASALNRPTLAIYGPTDPKHAPPFSDVARSIWLKLACAPCRQRECPLGHHQCMRNIVPSMVWKEIKTILASG